MHTLVAEPEEDLDSWIELVTLCRKEGAHSLCANLLRKLGAPLQPTRTEHQEDGGHEANTAPAIESPRVAGSPASKGKSTSAGNASPSAAGSAAAASPTIAEGITPLVGSTKDLNAASPRTNDRILLATYQYWWSHGEKERALRELTNYLRTSSLPPTDAAHSSNPATPVGPLAVSTAAAAAAAAAATVNAASGGPSPWKSSQEALMFRVRCLLKRAEWMESLEETNNVHEILSTLMEARDLAKDQYSVWHAWAVANYDQLKKVSTDDNAGAASPNPADASGARPSSASSSSAGSSTASSADSGTTSFPSYASSTASAAPVPPPPPRSASVTITKGIGGNAHHHAGANLTVKLHSTSGTATLLNLVSVSQQQADKVTTYVIEGIKGFVRSIVLGQGQPVANLLQDTLRLITLLFSYGSKKGVFQILDLELEKVPPENWLSVVPQLIARIHIKSPEISGLLRKLLCKVAASHPQALVCPISVAKNTSDNRQRAMATDVLAEVRKHNKQLVEEATMVSRELMRVAITPQELWFDGLEQAAQLYLDAKDISGMLAVLKDLHETMTEAPPTVASGTGWTATATGAGGAKSGAGSGQEGFSEGLGKIGVTTLRDVAFRQAYAKVLLDAWYWIEQFRSTGRTIDLHQAWEIYQSIFKKIKVQIAALKKLELHHVSPALTAAKELTLAVPGTYRPSAPIISINSFSPAVHVITSKQRPRKMCLMGSDGGKYPFLLKGHEDLRQDERVMQLFGLINVCLQNDRITSRHGLDIIRYSVLPLSNNSGLIGWVDNCDTLNQLIKRYRETKEIRLLMEMKLLQSKSSAHYDKLTVLQKTELFQQVLDETTGEDLMRMLWLKSKSSDVWIERRANFTKSLAVMSMVGYILGLGDRHPSNLMLDRISGRVVHIDFGDCFEITKHRAKYPEIVPFRLTRMLTNCMGVAGIEGTYRLTSERVSPNLYLFFAWVM